MYWPNQKMIHFPQMSSTLFIYRWQADGPCSLFKAGSSKAPTRTQKAPTAICACAFSSSQLTRGPASNTLNAHAQPRECISPVPLSSSCRTRPNASVHGAHTFNCELHHLLLMGVIVNVIEWTPPSVDWLGPSWTECWWAVLGPKCDSMDYALGAGPNNFAPVPKDPRAHSSAFPVVYGPFVPETMLLWAFNILVRGIRRTHRKAQRRWGLQRVVIASVRGTRGRRRLSAEGL
jgi:hypothetical protein